MLKTTMKAQGYDWNDMPRVFQYNKRDLPGAVPTDTLRMELNRQGAADFDSVATDGVGTMEAIEAMSRLVLGRLSPQKL